MIWPFNRQGRLPYSKDAPIAAELIAAAKALDIEVPTDAMAGNGLTINGGLLLQAKIIRKLAVRAA
jgi:hypothetical protein